MSSKLTNRPEWKALRTHQEQMRNTHLRTLFAQDERRFERFHIGIDGLLFDYSKNLITDETLKLLLGLAKECGIDNFRGQMFGGAAINTTEKRPALHVALRGSADKNLQIDGENVDAFVDSTLARIKTISEKIRSGKITDVIHLGIGGSELGPRMACEALSAQTDGPSIHFVSNIDGAHITQALKGLKPETTQFIIASKAFTTLVTMANAQTAKDWAGNTANFIAITANETAAHDFGIQAENILPLRDWIGGRYSVWSAIGLPVAIATGFENFEKFLAGARAADAHFHEMSLENNIPVIMALLGVWYRNFWDYNAQAILPYAQNLSRLPAYIQQLDMESNGKSTDRDGKAVDYATAPVIFGDTGTNAQHAFFQLLHQGTDIIPCDFIAAAQSAYDLSGHQEKLLANALAQSQALMQGEEAKTAPHRNFAGNRPSSTLLITRLDAYHLGLLAAMYEHKAFVQGAIWNLNSFDQWGVELGKKLALGISEALENNKEIKSADSSTAGLLAYLANHIK